MARTIISLMVIHLHRILPLILYSYLALSPYVQERIKSTVRQRDIFWTHIINNFDIRLGEYLHNISDEEFIQHLLGREFPNGIGLDEPEILRNFYNVCISVLCNWMNTKIKTEMLREMRALFTSLSLNYTDRNDVLEAYNNWAEVGYDKVYSSDVFYAPRKTAEVLEDIYPLDVDKKGVKILDVGAGTGLCGVELRKLGFKNIDGLEPSEKMMTEAMKKDVYDRYIIDFISDARLSIEDNFYDVVTACNCARHFPDGFPEIARIVKPGGCLVILSNFEDAGDKEMETMIQKLDDEGMWRVVRKEIIDEFFSIANQRGILFLIEVLTDGTKRQDQRV